MCKNFEEIRPLQYEYFVYSREPRGFQCQQNRFIEPSTTWYIEYVYCCRVATDSRFLPSITRPLFVCVLFSSSGLFPSCRVCKLLLLLVSEGRMGPRLSAMNRQRMGSKGARPNDRTRQQTARQVAYVTSALYMMSNQYMEDKMYSHILCGSFLPVFSVCQSMNNNSVSWSSNLKVNLTLSAPLPRVYTDFADCLHGTKSDINTRTHQQCLFAEVSVMPTETWRALVIPSMATAGVDNEPS